MYGYKWLSLLIVVMACVSVLVSGIAIWILYEAALDQQRARLTDTAQSQARLIESIARFNQQHLDGFPGGPQAATLQEIEDAHRQYTGFGKTGGFAFARREGDHIVFLHSHRAGLERPKPVPLHSPLAQPMQCALRNESGTMVGADYLGTKVLAAYEPVAELDMGIVAKIDMAEVRTPFVWAALVAGGAGSVVVMLGALFFVGLTHPILRRLQRREREFRTLAENVPALFSYVGADQRYRYVNRVYEQTFRQPASEMVGKAVGEIIGLQQFDVVRPHIETVLRGEQVVYEGEFELPDGVHAMHVHYVPDRDEQGQVQGFFELVTDITARKRAEAALQESEGRLRAILNTASDAIINVDKRGTIIAVNPATEKMFGYAKDELVGQSFSLLMPPPYRDEHEGYLSRYLETGKAQIIGIGREVSGMRKSGSTFPVDLAVSEVHDFGLFTGIVRDITLRKEAQEALGRAHEFSENLANTAHHIILVLDAQGRILRFNPYFEQLTGWRLDEVEGSDWFDTFLPEHDREQIRQLFGRAIGGERTRGYTNAILTKDGREREIEWYDAPLTSSDGEQIGLLCTGLDVSERRVMEREILEIAAEEQRRIGQELHDSTQQQLTGLSLLTQNLAAGLTKLSGNGAISNSADRMQELCERATKVQQGLEQAASEVSQLARGLIPVELDSQGLMSSLRELAASVSASQRIQCTFVSNGTTEVLDNTKATHLYRIAQEAVSNALKHSAAERIELSLEDLDGFITLRILDNGCGIGEKPAAGRGMGLRIMAYRAELIGAILTVDRRDGGGTEVVCRVRH